MNKKEEKKKVGRPKLADSKTKKESIFVSLFVFVVIIIVAILGFNILTIGFNPKYAVASVHNNHVNSCVVEDNKIDCGPNVTYVKYKIGSGSYTELTKQEKSIEIPLKNEKDVEVCYKTNNMDLRCNK